MNIFQNAYNGNSGFWTGGGAGTITGVTYYTTGNVIPWQAYQAPTAIPNTVPVVPGTPEAWLRQRVKEVCELAAA